MQCLAGTLDFDIHVLQPLPLPNHESAGEFQQDAVTCGNVSLKIGDIPTLRTSEKEDLLATCKSMTKAMDSCKSAAVVWHSTSGAEQDQMQVLSFKTVAPRQMFAGSQCFPTLILYVKTSVVFLREFSPRGPFPLVHRDRLLPSFGCRTAARLDLNLPRGPSRQL